MTDITDVLTPFETDVITQAENIVNFVAEMERRGGSNPYDLKLVSKMAENIINMHLPSYEGFSETKVITDVIRISIDSVNYLVPAQQYSDALERWTAVLNTAWPPLYEQVKAEKKIRGMYADLADGVQLRTYELAGHIMVTLMVEGAPGEIYFTWVGDAGDVGRGLGLHGMRGSVDDMKHLVLIVVDADPITLVPDEDIVMI